MYHPGSGDLLHREGPSALFPEARDVYVHYEEVLQPVVVKSTWYHPDKVHFIPEPKKKLESQAPLPSSNPVHQKMQKEKM
jgi:hypothetical protein